MRWIRKINKGGEVIIPKEIRDKFNLHKGSIIKIEIMNKSTMRIIPNKS